MCNWVLPVATWALVAYIVLGYVVEFGRLEWGHPIRRVYDLLGRGIRPVLRPIRDRIPSLRLGGVAIDLSILVLFAALWILNIIFC